MKLSIVIPAYNEESSIYGLLTKVKSVDLIGNLEKVTSLTNISTISIFILMNLSVIVMRFTKPNHSRHFKVPFNINNVPVPSLIGLISSVIFIFVTISNSINV